MSNFVWKIKFFLLNCLKKSKFVKNLPGKIKICQNVAWKNRTLLKICLERLKFFENLPEKSNFFVKLPEKNRNFSKICLKSQKFVDSDPRPSRFQTTGALPLDPAGGLPVLIRLLYVHPLVQFLNTPLLALNAHSGNEWGKIPVLTG